jgi:hypothetical protein
MKTGVQNLLKKPDSGIRRNDKHGSFSTSKEVIAGMARSSYGRREAR